MSDSEVIFGHNNLDLIDEDWVRDSLSDDEIEVTPGNEVPNDDSDIGTNTISTPYHKREEEKWNDLGIDGILNNN